MLHDSLFALACIVFITVTTCVFVRAGQDGRTTRVACTVLVFTAGFEFIPMNPLYAMAYCGIWGVALIAPWVTPRRRKVQQKI